MTRSRQTARRGKSKKQKVGQNKPFDVKPSKKKESEKKEVEGEASSVAEVAEEREETEATSPVEEEVTKTEDKNGDGDGDGDKYQLGKSRFINVTEFRGTVMVNIREYYEKDGKMLPGKKGISLQLDEWDKLKQFVDKIDEDVKKQK